MDISSLSNCVIVHPGDNVSWELIAFPKPPKKLDFFDTPHELEDVLRKRWKCDEIYWSTHWVQNGDACKSVMMFYSSGSDEKGGMNRYATSSIGARGGRIGFDGEYGVCYGEIALVDRDFGFINDEYLNLFIADINGHALAYDRDMKYKKNHPILRSIRYNGCVRYFLHMPFVAMLTVGPVVVAAILLLFMLWMGMTGL